MVSSRTLNDELVVFQAYFKGGSLPALKRSLSYYKNRPSLLDSNYRVVKLSSQQELAKKLFTVLGIAEKNQSKYLDLTLYEFLLLLSRKNQHHVQAAYALQLIDSHSRRVKLPLILLLCGLLIAGLGLLLLPPFAGVLVAIQAFLTSPLGLPVVGLIGTLLSSTFSFCKTAVDNTKNFLIRARDNLFLLSTTFLNVVGYFTLLRTAAAITPFSAGFFVMASAFNVIKDLVCLGQEYYQYLIQPKISELNSVGVKQNLARHTYSFNRHRNALLIDLSASIMLLGIMAAWCFLPAGFLLTAAAMTAIGLVYIAKRALLKYNDAKVLTQLQKELSGIEQQEQDLNITVPNALKQLNSSPSSDATAKEPKQQSSPKDDTVQDRSNIIIATNSPTSFPVWM